MKIALGAAKGIASILKGVPKFVHGHIKSTNVLIAQEHDDCINDVGLTVTPIMNTSSTMSWSNSYRTQEASESRVSPLRRVMYTTLVSSLKCLQGRLHLDILVMIMTWLIFQGGPGRWFARNRDK
jgi:hypothetical protein